MKRRTLKRVSWPRHLFAAIDRLGYDKRIDLEIMAWGIKQLDKGRYSGDVAAVMIDRQRNGW